MIKLCGFAVISAVLIMLLRELRGSLSKAVEISAAVIIFLGALLSVSTEIDGIRELIPQGIGGYFTVILRSLGIATLAEVTSDICRSCGAESAGKGIEVLGGAEIFILSLPLFTELLTRAVSLL